MELKYEIVDDRARFFEKKFSPGNGDERAYNGFFEGIEKFSH